MQVQIDYNSEYPADIAAVFNAEGLHYLVTQSAEYLIIAGYLSVAKFMETASTYELTVISQWLSLMPRDIMTLDEPSTAVRNILALSIVLIVGEGDCSVSLSKIMHACMNLQEYVVLELEFRQLNLMQSLEDTRKHYTVLER